MLAFSTGLGGDGSRAWEEGHGITVDVEGNACVTGYTASSSLPTVNAIQPANRGGKDAFVTKIISATGGYEIAF